MNVTIMTENGEIIVDNDVIAKCAGAAACECFGIVGMASINVRDGLAKLLKVENLANGVNVKVEDNKLRIDLHIIVSYGTNITAIVNSIAHRVRYLMEDICDFKVREINTYVDGMRE